MANLFIRTYTFVDGTIAYGSQVEFEIGAITTALNNLNTAATNWGQISVLHASNVPLVADCSSGSQDIADFKNNSVIKASIGSGGQLTLKPTTNQLVLGVTNTTTISATAPSVSRVYTIPDAGGAANFLLSGSGQIVNADVNASAAIALSKLAPLGTAKALQSNASTGAIEVSSVTNTELGYVSGVTSAIQTQLNAAVANPLTGNLAAGAHKITGLANGTAATDAAAFGQVPIFTNWTSFTPTGAWSTNTTYSGKYRRVGSVMECYVHIALTGAPTSATLTVNIPLSLSIDTGASIAFATTTMYGQGGGSHSGGYCFYVACNNGTSVQVLYQSAVTGAVSLVTQAAPVAWGNSDFIDLHFSVPISTWTEFS